MPDSIHTPPESGKDPGDTPPRRNTRLAGHVLIGEGRPILRNTCCGTELTHGHHNYYDRLGHGLCSCGAFGPCEMTNRARQLWHHDHKNEIRDTTSSSPPTSGEGK